MDYLDYVLGQKRRLDSTSSDDDLNSSSDNSSSYDSSRYEHRLQQALCDVHSKVPDTSVGFSNAPMTLGRVKKPPTFMTRVQQQPENCIFFEVRLSEEGNESNNKWGGGNSCTDGNMVKRRKKEEEKVTLLRYIGKI